MSMDDLTAPLGRQLKKRRRAIKLPMPQIIAGTLAAFLGVFVLWAVVADDPYGGEPWAVVPANLRIAAKSADIPAPSPTPPAGSQPHENQAAAASAPPPPASMAPNTTTITIIDGKTGERQDVVIPAPATGGAAPLKPLRLKRRRSTRSSWK